MADKILEFCVDEQRLSQRGNCNAKIVSKTLNYVSLQFKFHYRHSSMWNGLEKHIQFIYNNEHYEYIITNDIVKVPNFLVQGKGFKFLLVGYAQDNVRVTTNTLKVSLKETEYSENIDSYDDNIQDVYLVLVSRFDDYYTKNETDERISVDIKRAYQLLEYDIRTGGN